MQLTTLFFYFCFGFILWFVFCVVPRKVLLESFDVPMELDEQNQQESDYENELDEDDGHYKEAIPPAPKLQGTIPRSDSNTTQTITTKTIANASGDTNHSDSVQNQRSFSEGKLIKIHFFSVGFISKEFKVFYLIKQAENFCALKNSYKVVSL